MTPKKPVVTLEDLLRVKRAERPRPDFWAEFERELRTKQLAAIVEPRPWWAPFIRVGARFARYQLPVGAAAVLALSFVSVHEYRHRDRAASPFDLPAAAAAPATVMTAVESSVRAPSHLATPAPSVAQLPSAENATAEDAPSADSLAATGQSSHSVELAEPAPAVSEPTPSARYIAANLAAVQAADPKLVADVFGQPQRAVESRAPVRDPLAQISAPGESRRSRLLATALPAMAVVDSTETADVTVGSSDRLVRRLTEERLYDTMSRIGVKGDRVAFKF